MSIYKHDAGDQSMPDVVNPSLTYQALSNYEASPQPFNQSQPATHSFVQPFTQPTAHSFGHSSTPMSAQTSSVEAIYPAGPVSGYSTHHTDSMNNNNQVAFSQDYSGQALHASTTSGNQFGQDSSGYDGSATMHNNYGQHNFAPQPQNTNLRTINATSDILASPAASNIDLYSNHGSMAPHGMLPQHDFKQNTTLASQQSDFQAFANMNMNMNMNNGNNMTYLPHQPMFMPLPFNMMMPFQYGPHYNMYGQVFNTPALSVLEPPILMGPPSTIVSSVENWRHQVSSPAAETNTTGTSQKISPHAGFTSGIDNTFNPAVLATYNTMPMPTSEVDNRPAPVDAKPVIKKKKYSKARTCFVCTGINNEKMITCAFPDHKGTAMFHFECAGLSSKTEDGDSWYCNTCLNVNNNVLQAQDRASPPPLSPRPESDHSSYHPSPPKKKKLQRKSRRIYNAPTGTHPISDLFTPYSKPVKPYQPPSSATRSHFPEATPTNANPNPSGRGQTSHGGWSAAEDAACIAIMTNLIHQRTSNELKVPIDKMWELGAGRMASAGFPRSASGIKMQWTRRLRAITGLDERKVPDAAMMRTGLILKKRKDTDEESDQDRTVTPRGRRSGSVAPKRRVGAGKLSTPATNFVSAGKPVIMSGRLSKKKKSANGSVATSTPTSAPFALGDGRGKKGKKHANVQSGTTKNEMPARVDEGIAMIVERPFTTMVRDTEMLVSQKQYDDEEESEQSRGSSYFDNALEDTLMG